MPFPERENQDPTPRITPTNEDFAAVRVELDNAFDRWGDEFDNKNTLNDWVTYICMYATSAAKMELQDDPDYQYEQLIKAAGLCLNAATRVRRGKVMARHYDPKPSPPYTGD